MNKWFYIVKKSFKEQLRSWTMVLLTLSVAPIFVVFYYVIDKNSVITYQALVINKDKASEHEGVYTNFGKEFISSLKIAQFDSLNYRFRIKQVGSFEEAEQLIEQKKADFILQIPEKFSATINAMQHGEKKILKLSVAGDFSNPEYLITGLWTEQAFATFIDAWLHVPHNIEIKEKPIGTKAKSTGFNIYIPGLLILSILMLMFTSAIAFVNESELKTIYRIKLSGINSFHLLSGISTIQVFIGILAFVITLVTALLLGFKPGESIFLFSFIILLHTLSIIAFSLIIAAFTRTANQVLVIGNFPLFLFMFFSGAMFPISPSPLFHIGDYPISYNFFIAPVHAVSALEKIINFNKEIYDILPELFMITILTILYFTVGWFIFKQKHLKINR